MWRDLFQNTSLLTCLIWRRDRVRIPVWIISIAIITFIVALAYPSLFKSEVERQLMAETMKNPAMIAMVGPGYGLDNYHTGAIMAHEMLLFTAITVAIMNIMLTIRHTRHDEENGRIEMIRSLPVGKLANSASTLLVLTAANVCLGLIVGLGLSALGIESMDLPGSLLYGAVLTVTGILFAAVTTLFAQLTETSRATTGYSFAFLGFAYLVRAIGDVSSETLALLSPLGLILRTQVYVNNYWWPIIITLLAAVVVTIIALWLNTIRDLEAGFISAKPGRKYASPLLLSPFGLMLRLEKTTLIGWAVGVFILGISYGSIFGDIDHFFQTSDLYQLLLPTIEGFSLTDQFVAMLLSIMAMISAIPALLVVLKLRSEEKANRIEHLLARAVSRTKLMGSCIIIAVFTAVIMQVLSVLGLWIAAKAVMEHPFQLGPVMQGAMYYLPSIWILVGLAALLTALTPKTTSLAWIYLGYTFFVVYLGGLLQLPEWMAKLTPFGYVPNVPMESWSTKAMLFWTLIASAIMGLGLYNYHNRDVLG